VNHSQVGSTQPLTKREGEPREGQKYTGKRVEVGGLTWGGATQARGSVKARAGDTCGKWGESGLKIGKHSF